MDHPKAIGDRSTLAIIAALDLAGHIVSMPFGENSRYDLVIHGGSSLVRVQCKTGRLRGGAVHFKPCSVYAHQPNPKILYRDYHGEVDAFAVYCPENGAIYLSPISELPSHTMASLRVDPARNGQVRGIREAASYEIGRVRTTLSSGPRASSGARRSSS